MPLMDGVYDGDGETKPIRVDENGYVKMVMTGNTVIDYFEGSTSVTKTYEAAYGLSVANDDDTNDLTFTVNDMTITVKAGESFDGNFEKFTTLDVTGTAAHRVVVRG